MENAQGDARFSMIGPPTSVAPRRRDAVAVKRRKAGPQKPRPEHPETVDTEVIACEHHVEIK